MGISTGERVGVEDDKNVTYGEIGYLDEPRTRAGTRRSACVVDVLFPPHFGLQRRVDTGRDQREGYAFHRQWGQIHGRVAGREDEWYVKRGGIGGRGKEIDTMRNTMCTLGFCSLMKERHGYGMRSRGTEDRLKMALATPREILWTGSPTRARSSRFGHDHHHRRRRVYLR